MSKPAVFLMTISALDELDQPVTLRFASGTYDEDGLDWEYRLDTAALFSISAYSEGLISNSESGFGESTLKNLDGALNYLVDYAIDGRSVVVDYFDGFTTNNIFTGTAAGFVFERNQISVKLRDPQAILELDFPMETYAGDNVLPDGLEGTEDDIKGQVKPIVLGDVENAEPVLVNTSKLIYQVSSNDCTISAAYDRGVPFTFGGAYTDLAELQSTAPAPGQFRTFQGYLRLGSSPTGTLTCDAVAPDTWAGDVFEQIVTAIGYNVTASTVTDLNAVGEIGIYLTEKTATARLLDRICQSVGGYWTFNLSTTIEAQLLVAPVASPALEVEAHQVLSIVRESSGAGSNGVPIYQVTVKADRIEQVQNDLTGAVSAERVARLSSQFREATATRPLTKNRHLLAEEMTIESDLRSLTAAQAVADRLADLFSVRRDRVTIESWFEDYQTVYVGLDLMLTTERYGYTAGRPLKVLGYEIDTKTNKVLLSLWG